MKNYKKAFGKSLGTLRLKPEPAGWEEQAILQCYADPPLEQPLERGDHLVKVENGGSVLDLPDDDLSGLLQPEVKVSAPERVVEVVREIRELLLDRQRPVGH